MQNIFLVLFKCPVDDVQQYTCEAKVINIIFEILLNNIGCSHRIFASQIFLIRECFAFFYLRFSSKFMIRSCLSISSKWLILNLNIQSSTKTLFNRCGSWTSMIMHFIAQKHSENLHGHFDSAVIKYLLEY